MRAPSPMLIALAAVMCAACMNALMKGLAADEAVIVLTAWRYLFGGLFALIVFFIVRPKLPGPDAIPFHVVRGAIQLASAYLFFWALTQISLAEATVLGFTSALMIAPVARVVLKERISGFVVAASFAGFAGVALAVSGGTGTPLEGGDRVLGIASALSAAFGYAIALVLLRQRSKSEAPATLAMFTNVVPAALLLPVLLFMAPSPELGRLPLYALTGLFGFGIWSLMTVAYSRAPAAQLAPLEYTSLIWATLIGWAVFAEVPDWRLWAGAAIIVSACLAVAFESRFVTRRETRLPASDVLD